MAVTWTDLQEEAATAGENASLRVFRILATTERSQTGFMTIAPGQEAGPPETHDADQVFHFVEGEAEVKVWDPDEQGGRAGPGTVIVVPAGVRHWVKSVGDAPLLFFTVYAPPAY